jgi:hypothetical protein
MLDLLIRFKEVGWTMQDRQTPVSSDAQQRMQLSALYQNQLPYGALPSASSDAFYPNIENLYIFRDTSEVASFLQENQFLIPLLVESYPFIFTTKRHNSTLLSFQGRQATLRSFICGAGAIRICCWSQHAIPSPPLLEASV